MLAWQHDGLFGDALADGTVQLQLQALHVRLPGAQKRQGVVFFIFYCMCITCRFYLLHYET